MRHLKILAVSITSRQIGLVCLHRGVLVDWAVSYAAAKSENTLVGYLQEWINQQRPDVIVTEKCGPYCRKGKRSQNRMAAAAELASYNPPLDIAIVRPQPYPTKQIEAETLGRRYPELAGYVPSRKRRFFDPEPRGMGLFEALILAEKVAYGPPGLLAKAMG